MDAETQNDYDIEEIFTHVKLLKDEQEKPEEIDKVEFESIKTTNDIPPENIFEIVGPEELLEQNVSKMKVDIESSGTCDICGQEFVFDDNLSGLTILGKFFSCEKCCQVASKDTLDSWINYKNAKLKDIKPIALWLMQEKNKTRLFDK